jgi:CheY-like chemotaxis protein
MSAAHEHILKHYYTGYDAYLKKPFTKAELLSLLQKLLPTPKP